MTRVDIFNSTLDGREQRFRFSPHSGKAKRAAPLDAYSDAILIAELERRTKIALARPSLEIRVKPKHGPYDDWRTKAREATDKLGEAIKRSGLRP